MQLPPEFWNQTPLEALSHEQWEMLCDGCAKCCMNKLEDMDTGEIQYTNVVCDLLDLDSCQCSDYPNRSTLVPECVTLTPVNTPTLHWMPQSCAYRLRAEGKPLPHWHPLISGNPLSLVRAGQSICGRVIHEKDADDLEHHLITWVQ
jgi:uncharacterized cysteine cluster protein YcgN (CxxCxxCC family)